MYYQGTETGPVELLRNKLLVKKRLVENINEGRVLEVNRLFRAHGKI